MTIPSRVEIKPGIFYHIAYVDSFESPDIVGYCFGAGHDSRARMILILKSASPEDQHSTYIHELLHAVAFEYGIKIPHKVIHDLEGPLSRILLMNSGVFGKSEKKPNKKRMSKKKKGR